MKQADSDKVKFITNQLLSNKYVVEKLSLSNESLESQTTTINNIINNDLLIPGYFDSEFYLSEYVDVYDSGMLAIEHYLLFGREEGRIGYESRWSSIVDQMFKNGECKAVLNFENGEKKVKYETIFDNYTKYGKSFYTCKKLSCKWFQDIDSGTLRSPIISYTTLERHNIYEKVETLLNIKRLMKRVTFYHKHELNLLLELAFSSDWNINELDKSLAISESNHYDLFDLNFVQKELNIKGNSIVEIYSNWFSSFRKLTPNKYFLSTYYTSEYGDLKQLEYPFEHYALNGRFEGRKPNQFVSKIQFGSHKTCQYKSLSILDKYPFLSYFEESSVDSLNLLIDNISGLVKNERDINALISLINNQFFIDFFKSNNLKDAIVSWKENDFTDKAIILFDIDYLSKKLDTNLVNFEDAFLAWREIAKAESISTSPLFDQHYYLDRYLDLKYSNINAFEHYLHHGQHENRSPCRYIDPLWIRNTYTIGTLSGLDFFACSDKKIKPSPGLMPIDIYELQEIAKSSYESSWFDTTHNQVLKNQLEKANKIDPRIKLHDPSRIYTLMPYNMDFYAEIKGLESKIPSADILIFRDSINFGGADVVLSHLYRALKIIEPTKNIKIISFGEVEDKVVSSRDINPNDVINLKQLKGMIPLEHQANVVYDIIIGTKADQVYNVNSYGAWEAFKKYGKSLTQETKLFGYLFCDDRDEFGNIAGYPASYFFPTIEHLSRVYLDSESLLSELVGRGVIINRYASKIKVLKTPFEPFNNINDTIQPKISKKIAWAGRFDEQKKPELLIKIARLMPEYEFHVWGKAVLSNKEYNFSKCKNIILHGLYDDINELLHQDCSLYLYTSGWDGIPTILLDVVNLGLPIVASNVGGVAEAVPSWSLVDEIDNPAQYVDKINSILANYENSLNHMGQYKEMLLEKCSFENYCFEIGNN
ncbi:glycosyltransferase [Vibrio natriegens]|uniref:Glycosyl transferase family 1 domain-containing protein n=1 Tax=Vibrio natriegens NBRC 15636 = ATCC 14048 = DSM 759 TaxID=1219067 RepID=A0AAN0Y0N6_VIBNA|nr:glycosyltransferase [Vibrio natriegens]ALR16701.1 hypothetical protein PN96_12245 [Vibrio natriegens NBRC 15636 = ATCC 14048 = DSM 759]ANQ11433.1 hypothetical protein BA890_01085 [Vibrio natriegens NBRC 15636 = ATCC 14048 = DSM 759]EPM38998.1 hypothetical protein M272_18645 [Vibrio natriegens NBRC 15636 = ATCC 14048 = DSM 759]MDX6025763.1 glycosyltransferase [Vibrio natriegens NBRC 15636 = ATCC 14048 = DSM 759]UUI11881.1 glycosyltransferase [Vibrio natriegens]